VAKQCISGAGKAGPPAWSKKKIQILTFPSGACAAPLLKGTETVWAAFEFEILNTKLPQMMVRCLNDKRPHSSADILPKKDVVSRQWLPSRPTQNGRSVPGVVVFRFQNYARPLQ
jgi:hypothetical protein